MIIAGNPFVELVAVMSTARVSGLALRVNGPERGRISSQIGNHAVASSGGRVPIRAAARIAHCSHVSSDSRAAVVEQL